MNLIPDIPLASEVAVAATLDSTTGNRSYKYMTIGMIYILFQRTV